MAKFEGIPAAAGLAKGKVLILRGAHLEAEQACGTTSAEMLLFARAVKRAKEQLGELSGRLGGEAADILEFQIELLDDPQLVDATIAAVRTGDCAVDAWRRTLSAEVEQYRSGADKYLSARADDLIDLQERVEANIRGVYSMGALASSGASDIILVADLLTPSRFLELDLYRIKGIAMSKGSPSSHVCILARARAIPVIVGCGDRLVELSDGTEVLLDADAGILTSDASDQELAVFSRRQHERAARHEIAESKKTMPAITRSGEPVGVLANIDHPRLLDTLDPAPFDGVGLVRTEFLFENDTFPTEDEQVSAYRAILDWAAGRPVTIRVLDAGGDKPIADLTFKGEQNPFLGVRGIRLWRHHPEIFRTQLRALARAAAHGALKVMVPMVTVPRELTQFRAEMAAIVAELDQSSIDCRQPPIGMMVEVPSAALLASDFDTDFFSIGTNDLTQYALAIARDEYRLGDLAKDGMPAISKLIGMVVDASLKKGVDVSVCGDVASLPEEVGGLLNVGVRNLSVAPAAVADVKQAVREWAPAGMCE